VQNTSNKDSVCKFICEVYFCPQYCFALFWWPVLWSLQKFILILNFIFNILNPLWVREEKKWLESDLKRERYHFNDFSYQLNVKFLFQMVPYDEGSLNWLFFFNQDRRLGRNWFSGWFLVLDFFFFALLELKYWFYKVIMMFSKYFWLKMDF